MVADDDDDDGHQWYEDWLDDEDEDIILPGSLPLSPAFNAAMDASIRQGDDDMMGGAVIYSVGPHQFKLLPDGALGWCVHYNLFGQNGVTVRERPGTPNARGWTTSRRTFNQADDAFRYGKHLLRKQDKEND